MILRLNVEYRSCDIHVEYLTPTVVLGGFYGKVMTDSMNDKLARSAFIRTVHAKRYSRTSMEARSALPYLYCNGKTLVPVYRTLHCTAHREAVRRTPAERSRTNESNRIRAQRTSSLLR